MDGASNKVNPLPCFFCDKLLYPVFENWDNLQPDDGGEIQFIFAWGSRHDLDTYHALICDDCLDKYKEKMLKVSKF